MPTLDTEFRAPNKLPDIFRTINGINIDIGPFDRLRDSDLQQKPAQPGTSVRVQENAVPSDRKQFPRIILRDALGYELDTFTALQEAIYRAKWNVKQSGLAKEPLEWRLPKAPPPARPDLTRTCPPPKHPPVHHTDDRIRSRWEHSRVLEFDVEDVGFVRESLQYLPYAPSLSFLRQEILVGPKTYFQIVGTMLLHRKILSQTEKRHAIYNFPGFCTGCTRMGLCYGCERGTELHFHEDKPVKTGGGFTYFKKDRPENEIKSRNPVNWRIQQPDKALKKLMEEYTGVELEGPLPDEIKKLLDKHGGHRERIVSNIPDFAREMQEMAKKENKSRDRSLPEIHVRYRSQEDFDDDLENQSRGQSEGHYEGQLNPDDVRISMKGEDDMLGDEEYGDYMYQDQRGFTAGMDEEGQSRGDKGLSPNQAWPGGRNLKARYPAAEGQRGGASDEEGHWLPVSQQLESDEENAADEETDTEPYGQRRSRRKERLYKAPPPFKLKKSPKRSTVSRSPFSTERSYDLPKGKGFQVKKSDKPLTEFKEFRNVDVSWKEPKKFELKKTEQKSTKFWSGPPKKKAEKTEKRERSQDQDGHGRRRAPSPRSLSPDSGHDSEFHTASKKHIVPARGEQNTQSDINESEDDMLDRSYLPDKHKTKREKKRKQNRQKKRDKMVVNSGTAKGGVLRHKENQTAPVSRFPNLTNSKTISGSDANDMDHVADNLERYTKVPKLPKLVDGDGSRAYHNAEKSHGRKCKRKDISVQESLSQDKPKVADPFDSDENNWQEIGSRKQKESKGNDGIEERTKEADLKNNDYYNRAPLKKKVQKSDQKIVKYKNNNVAAELAESSLDIDNVYEGQPEQSQSKLQRRKGFHRARKDPKAEQYQELHEEYRNKDHPQDCSDEDQPLNHRAENSSRRRRAENSSPGRKTLKQKKFSDSGSWSESSWSESRSDGLRIFSPNNSSLDDYHDTAAEYYRHFDPEEFRRTSSSDDLEETDHLRLPSNIQKQKGLRKASRKRNESRHHDQQNYIMYEPRTSTVSPIVYKGDNSGPDNGQSESEDDWNASVKDVHKLMKRKITLSDLESEASVRRNAVKSPHVQPEAKPDQTDDEGKDTVLQNRGFRGHHALKSDGTAQKRGPVKKQIAFPSQLENGKKTKTPGLTSQLGEVRGAETLTKLPGIAVNNTDLRYQFEKNALIHDKASDGRATSMNNLLSGTNTPISRGSSTRATMPEINIGSNERSRSKSFVKEYQRVFQRQHSRRAESLPVLLGQKDLEPDEKRNEGKQKGIDKIQDAFSLNPKVRKSMYDKHLHENLRAESRVSKRSLKESRAESLRNDAVVDEEWSEEVMNWNTRQSLKVPTGRRESFMSVGQSQFTGTDADRNINDSEPPESFSIVTADENYLQHELASDEIRSLLEKLKSDENNKGNITFPCLSPPKLPVGVENDRGSLSSREPDLGLAFDDIIDVDNLEIVEYDLPDISWDELMKTERRRKHKHRRHRKDKTKKYNEVEGENRENIQDEKEITRGIETKEENFKHRYFDEESTNTSAYKEDEIVIEEVARENSKILESQQEKSVRHAKYKKEKAKIASKKRVTKDLNVKTKSSINENEVVDGSHIKDKSDLSEEILVNRSRQAKKKAIKSKNPATGVLHIDQSLDSYEDKNRGISLDREDSYTNKNRKSHSSRDGRGVNKKLNSTRKPRSKERVGRQNTKTRQKRKNDSKANVSDSEVDFDQLPSIKSQLAKLFPSMINEHHSTGGKIDTTSLDSGSEEEVSKQKVIESEENEDELDEFENKILAKQADDERTDRKEFKLKSDDDDGKDVVPVSVFSMKKGRSISMPLLQDLENFREKLGIPLLTLDDLKKPFKVPVYLPSFNQGKRIILKKQFKSNPKRVKGRERSLSLSVVTLSPLLDLGDTTAKSELEPVREESVTVTPEPNMGLSERTGTPLQLRVTSPADKAEPVPVSPVPKKKREIIKKEKKVRTPVPPLVPVEEPKPPTPVAKEKTPSPVPSEERPASRELSFDFVKEPSVPELPPIEVPALPEIPERQSEYKGVKKERKLIEVTPELPEPKKKLPPPPKLAPRIKTRSTRRSKIPAEAPVTAQELQQLADPLDFLAKYCIINPDRLPFYERVFNGAVNIQTPRYSKDNVVSRGEIVHLPPAQLSEHELNMLRDLTVITHAQTPRREGLSVPEQYMEKLNYTIEFIKMKQMKLQQHMHKVQVEKMKLMAKMAKEMDRDIVRVDYKTKKSKKKKEEEDENSPKKKKKKKSDEPDYDSMGAMSVPKNFRPQRASDITDEVIVSRMDDKMLKKVKKDPEIKKYTLEISRDIEKLKAFDQRIAQIEDEKDLVGIYCMDYYFSEQNGTAAPHEFRRQQSRLYQKLHPDLDIEMNVEEVETALQQVNNKLLTEKEFQYIFFILDLPKRQKINFRLFSIIAALSEKVTQMDPVIRKLLNKVDYNALDVKMEKSKELFELLQDETMPVGNAPADVLAVELTAGGLTPEHTNYVLSKFDREGRGLVDFLDFVTYIPLFIEIHKRIIEDPFNESLDV